jgi:hypothetical protein
MEIRIRFGDKSHARSVTAFYRGLGLALVDRKTDGVDEILVFAVQDE